MKTLLTIGECMVELAQQADGSYRRGFAGDTFNTAWYARKLLPDGWDVAYLTALGDDAMSDAMQHFMEAEGVSTRFVRRIKGTAPGLYMISLDKGERSFSYWRDTSAAKRLAEDEVHLEAAMAQADAIFFSGVTLAILPPADGRRLIDAASRERRRGKLVAFDTQFRQRVWKERSDVRDFMLAAAAASHIVLPGLDDEQAMFGTRTAEDVARRYQGAGAETVVVKDGEKGATVFAGETATHVPAAIPSAVVDTTAAGDSFNAGLLTQIIAGNDAVTAARFAAGIAAQVVARRGALVDVVI